MGSLPIKQVSSPTVDGVELEASITQMDTPMVRMNFDPSIGIAEEVSETGAILGQNMPNPFDNNSTINFELANTSDVQFEFVDHDRENR